MYHLADDYLLRFNSSRWMFTFCILLCVLVSLDLADEETQDERGLSVLFVIVFKVVLLVFLQIQSSLSLLTKTIF